jgi:uncharacterized protein with NRDE domain
MCTIALLIDTVDGAPIVLAANRDELYARPTRPPEVLGSAGGHAIVGGVDVQSGGTWLAVRADGHFAAVTNQRALVTPPPGLRSRGHAVYELAAAADPDRHVDALDPGAYASMNLAWRSARGVSIAYTRREDRELMIEHLSPGIHVLCNDRLGAAGFPRGERLHEAITRAVRDRLAWPQLAGVLATALADHTRESLADTPQSHLPPELARELTATCIHSAEYGTRSATIVALARDRVLDFRHADGPPCTAPFVDRMELLR